MLREGVLMSATSQIKIPEQLGWAKSYKILYVAFKEFIHDHLIILELDGLGPIKKRSTLMSPTYHLLLYVGQIDLIPCHHTYLIRQRFPVDVGVEATSDIKMSGQPCRVSTVAFHFSRDVNDDPVKHCRHQVSRRKGDMCQR